MNYEKVTEGFTGIRVEAKSRDKLKELKNRTGMMGYAIINEALKMYESNLNKED